MSAYHDEHCFPTSATLPNMPGLLTLESVNLLRGHRSSKLEEREASSHRMLD